MRGAAANAFVVMLALLFGSCGGDSGDQPAREGDVTPIAQDPHSFARPAEVAVQHLDLDLAVDFETRRISGRATLTLDNAGGHERLHLDTRGLEITSAHLEPGGREAAFQLGGETPFLGRELVVEIEPDTERVTIDYASSPGAAALQWLSPAQTDGKRHPFLFTQSQAILARTWVPCQDSPAVRMTYEATVRVPAELMAVMSAENPTERAEDGVYRFSMPQAIPSYLLALAVGDLEFRPLGERSGVYAEPGVVERAAWEFAEVEPMMAAAEKLYGPYRWGRYDLLVLPPSFPFGGMENPRLTFATPTILAGDRSLVALVAHELAHSWSGNLVTNATWNDFWLNEGFTSYIENRIMEEIKGPEYAKMLRALSLQDLEDEITDLGHESPDTHLFLDLAGRDPDDGMTSVAYDKGAGLLRLLEERVGRERFDAFLLRYFDAYGFRSLTTEGFLGFLHKELLADPAIAGKAPDLDAWIFGPGIPQDFPHPGSMAFAEVERQLEGFAAGGSATDLATDTWTTHEWLHFLRNLPEDLSTARLTELDGAFDLSGLGNKEILAAWLTAAIDRGHDAVRPELEDFLLEVGRRKFLKPIYTALTATDEGREWAIEVYARARPGYHSISSATIDDILGVAG